MIVNTQKLKDCLGNLGEFILRKSVIAGCKSYLCEVYPFKDKQFLRVQVIKDGLMAWQNLEVTESDEMAGVYLIPAEILETCIDGVKTPTVNFKKTKNGVKVGYGKGYYEIKTLNAGEIQKLDNFKLIIGSTEMDWVNVRGCDLYNGMKNALLARPSKKSMYVDGTRFVVKHLETNMFMYSTDGVKMNTSYSVIKSKKDFNFAIPNKILAEISMIIPDIQSDVEVKYDGNLIVFLLGENYPTIITKSVTSGMLAISSIEGVIYNTRKSGMQYIQVENALINMVLKRACNYLDSNCIGMHIGSKNGELIFSSGNNSIGSFKEVIPYKGDKMEDFNIQISPVSLKKSLSFSGEITMGVKEGYPVVVRNKEGDIENYVMPVKE